MKLDKLYKLVTNTWNRYQYFLFCIHYLNLFAFFQIFCAIVWSHDSSSFRLCNFDTYYIALLNVRIHLSAMGLAFNVIPFILPLKAPAFECIFKALTLSSSQAGNMWLCCHTIQYSTYIIYFQHLTELAPSDVWFMPYKFSNFFFERNPLIP